MIAARGASGALPVATLLAAALLAASLFVAACDEQRPAAAQHLQPREIRGATMGTTFVVRWFDQRADAPSLATVENTIHSTLGVIDQRFSTWRDDSLISRFNAHRDDGPFETDADFVAVLRAALHLAELTDGAYDPTILPLSRVWGFHRDPGSAPNDDEIAEVLHRVGWQHLQIVEPTSVRKLLPAIEIDLASIAEGHGVDAVSAALLREHGIGSSMVEIGGEVMARGAKPDGSGWRIGIERPTTEDTLGSDVPARHAVDVVVALVDRGLATSGSYRNYREAGGRRVHHVLDARTGRNATHTAISVSVIAPTCGQADALATALLITGPDAGRPIFEAMRDAGAALSARWLVAEPDGSIRVVALSWPGE